jgi:formate dehydrogenase major subunit
MTNHWVDMKNANLIIVMGGNAEAHPVGFRWAMEAKIHNGAKLIVIDPRFTRTASVADFYTPIRSGTDIAFLSGVLLYLLTNEKYNREYTEAYTNASLIVREDFGFEDGLFTGYDAEKRKYDRSSWNYELDEQGFAKRDTTLTHPRCVWNLLKQHVSRYTPEVVENICGTPKADFLKVCEYIAETSAHDKTASFLYALGWTQHSVGAQNIRTMAMIQLLLGNMGMAGGGVNALRGHSNIQGLTDLGLLSQSLPGYMTLPSEKQTDLQTYLTANTPKPLLQGQVNYWGNYSKFFVSMMKAFYGEKATKENSWGFDWLPKWDKSYDVLQYFDMMFKGQVNGYICQGFNPVASFPNKNKVVAALSKLKFLVTIDPLNTETSTFWQNHGESNDVDSSKIQTEVFRLPCTCFAEENGSIVNSGRWLQWHWKGQDAPGKRSPTVRFWQASSCACAKCTPKRAALTRTGAEHDLELLHTTRTGFGRGGDGEQRQGAGGYYRSGYQYGLVKKVSSSVRSPSCVTTVPPPAAAGFSPVAGRRTATRWPNAIMPTRQALAIRSAGHGRGRLTVASCITAPPLTRRVNRGIRNASS